MRLVSSSIIARLVSYCCLLTLSTGAALPEVPPKKEVGSSEAFISSIKSQFGGKRISFFYKRGILSDQILEGLSHFAPERTLRDGRHLVSGCRPHSCTEKVAVVATPQGKALAVGFINYRCEFLKGHSQNCSRRPRLTLVVPSRNNMASVLEPIRQWAVRVSAGGYKRPALTETLILR
jgi:hypothetical protein